MYFLLYIFIQTINRTTSRTYFLRFYLHVFEIISGLLLLVFTRVIIIHRLNHIAPTRLADGKTSLDPLSSVQQTVCYRTLSPSSSSHTGGGGGRKLPRTRNTVYDNRKATHDRKRTKHRACAIRWLPSTMQANAASKRKAGLPWCWATRG